MKCLLCQKTIEIGDEIIKVSEYLPGLSSNSSGTVSFNEAIHVSHLQVSRRHRVWKAMVEAVQLEASGIPSSSALGEATEE